MINESLNILLADDEENDRLLFVNALKELKINAIIHTVNDGVELMEYLNMPRRNGLECLKEIRANYKLKDIAIAIFSTSRSLARASRRLALSWVQDVCLRQNILNSWN